MKVEYIQHCGTDLIVANAARVSFHKESEWDVVGYEEEVDFEARGVTRYPIHKLSDKDAGLIDFLAREGHKSPFNHTFISCRVKAPIFVARQLVKHEYMPWNEVSRRYVTDELEVYWTKEWRSKADNVKQGSGESVDMMTALACATEADAASEAAIQTYNTLLSFGVCPEQARMVLPQSLYTEWWWSGTLYAWAKMLTLRLDSHTQKETRDVAQQCRDIIEPLFPIALPKLLHYGVK